MPILCVLGTVWLWSLIPLAVKVAYQSFDFGFIALSRFVVGTLVFGAVELASGRGLRLPPREARPKLAGPSWIGPIGWIVIAGLAIGGDLLLYTLGMRDTTASAATLIVSTDGVLLAMLGVLWLRQQGYFRAGPVVEHHPDKVVEKPIELNTARWWELTLIRGIGEVRATEIVALRERKRREQKERREKEVGFKSIDELSEVRGITADILERIK